MEYPSASNVVTLVVARSRVPRTGEVHDAAWPWQMKRDKSAAQGPHDLDAIDSLGPGYRPARLAWDLDQEASPNRCLPRVDVRPVSRPIDPDNTPPMRSATDGDRAEGPAHRRPLARKPSVPSQRAKQRPRRSVRSWLTLVAGGLVFAVSFAVALRVTKPPRPPTAAMTMLAGATISDLRGLMAAVKAAGLKGTPDIKGGIDEIIRRDNDHVTLKGWAAQIADSDAPLAVMVFVDGRNMLTTETNGSRPEITAALGLSETASANISFEGDLACGRRQQFILVAVSRSGVYGHFGSKVCP
jgi:hypothetical protein